MITGHGKTGKTSTSVDGDRDQATMAEDEGKEGQCNNTSLGMVLYAKFNLFNSI